MISEQNNGSCDTVKEVAEQLISEAVPVATELCQHGAMSRLASVVCGDAEKSTVVVTVGLLQGLLFLRENLYRERNEQSVPIWLRKQVVNAIARAGDARFFNRFSDVWRSADAVLHTNEATLRINKDGHSDSIQQRYSAIVECVNWSLKELDAGRPCNLLVSNQLLFMEIVQTFGFFCFRHERIIDWDVLSSRKGDEIDISKLPIVKDNYDIFISYRRSDGLPYARILKQELGRKGYKCFLDVDMVVSETYNLHILASLKASRNVIFLMTNDALGNIEYIDNPVRIELETARKLGRSIIIVAPTGTTRTLDGIELPSILEFLRDLQKYRLECGEFFEDSIRKILLKIK